MNGWIKLWRKTLESDMYQSLNSVQRDVMITCLLLANHRGKEWEWNGEVYKAKPGQFVTSLQSLEERCAKDVTIQNIRTALKKLESWEFLTNESTKSGRLVTIVNWGMYQHKDTKLTKSATENQQRTNKELTTNKNDKRSLKKNLPQARAIVTGENDERTEAEKQLSYFCKKYTEKYNNDYYIRRARKDQPDDPELIANMVEQLGSEEVADLIDYFFDTWVDYDEFSKSNPTISVMESQVQKMNQHRHNETKGISVQEVIG